MFDAVSRDVRHSVRSLAARPTYPLVAILTLALVAGAGGAVFAVVNATFVRALPFPDGDRLVRLYTHPPGTSAAKDRNPLHPLEFARFRRGLRTADAVEGFFGRARAVGGTDEPESVAAAQASAGGKARTTSQGSVEAARARRRPLACAVAATVPRRPADPRPHVEHRS